jgi:hypothetical protein
MRKEEQKEESKLEGAGADESAEMEDGTGQKKKRKPLDK